MMVQDQTVSEVEMKYGKGGEQQQRGGILEKFEKEVLDRWDQSLTPGLISDSQAKQFNSISVSRHFLLLSLYFKKSATSFFRHRDETSPYVTSPYVTSPYILSPYDTSPYIIS